MSQETQRHEITKKAAVYRMTGVEAVTVRRDMTYRVTEAGPLGMDLYSPPDSKTGARRPAVVFVIGFSDVGAQKILGCQFREMESYVSWARLVAASGMVAITYTNRDPATDIRALLQYVRQNAESLGIDENRIGLWACSGNVPLALTLVNHATGPHAFDVFDDSETSREIIRQVLAFLRWHLNA